MKNPCLDAYDYRERTFSLCPDCGLDRVVAIAALNEPDDPDGLESENKAMVNALVGNCQSCRDFIREHC